MRVSPWRRTGLMVLLLVALGGSALGLIAVALDQGGLHGPLVRWLSWRTGRTLTVGGALHLHLLSAHPTLEAFDVTLGNPPWTRPGTFGSAKHLILSFRWGRGIDALQLAGANLTLLRDTEGFANWQFRRPTPGRLPTLPSLEALQAVDVHLYLNDAQRHLEFDGVVSGGSADGRALELTAQGTLNGHPAHFTLAGAALRAPPTAPYPFEFAATGSGAHLSLKGALPKPFELDLFDGSFEAAGADLKDLYFLVGMRLVNTADFRVSGRIERRGILTRLSRLSLSTSQSDLEGSLSINTPGPRPRLEGELHSRTLRTNDFGLRAAGRDPNPDPPLVPDAELGLAGMRQEDVVIRYAADRLQLGRLELSSVTGRLQLALGVIDVPVFDGRLLGGRLSAQLHLDARQDVPAADIRLQLQGGELHDLPLKMEVPPVSGPLQASAHFTGRGRSVHAVAATLAGNAQFQVGQGIIRASIAELAGLDLRGVGLTLSGSQREIGLRCAVGRLQAVDGTLRVAQLLIDTDTVLIQGEGSLQLGDESIDLKLRGAPKQTRLLRLATPLLIKGTLRHPIATLQTEGAALKLIDRGRVEEIDCSAH